MTPGDSSRTLPSLSLIRRVLAEAAPGAIDLALGVPTHPVPAKVRRALVDAIDGGLLGYTPNAGLPELRRRIARRRPHHGDSGDSVGVTVGSQEALALAILGLSGPGDEVILPELCYPSYEALARFAGAEVVRSPVGEMAAAVGSRTRLAVVASPDNPTGAVVPRRIFEELSELASERGFHLVCDEIYEEIRLTGDPPFHPAGERVVHLGGISKSLGAPGLRLGWLIADPETVDRLIPLHQHLVTCAPALSQAAAIAGLQLAVEELDAVREHYRTRWNAARRALVELPEGVEWEEPRGAFYVLLDVERLVGPETVSFALDVARRGLVAVVPGEAFGPSGGGRLRLSFCAREEDLAEGIGRLGEALRRGPRGASQGSS